MKKLVLWIKKVLRIHSPSKEWMMVPRDVRSVVYCKDCRWYKESELLAPNRFCFRLQDKDGKPVGYNFADMDFCSYGERRAEIRPVVLCRDCIYNDNCFAQSILKEMSRIPFNKNKFFCADGKRREAAAGIDRN